MQNYIVKPGLVKAFLLRIEYAKQARHAERASPTPHVFWTEEDRDEAIESIQKGNVWTILTDEQHYPDAIRRKVCVLTNVYCGSSNREIFANIDFLLETKRQCRNEHIRKKGPPPSDELDRALSLYCDNQAAKALYRKAHYPLVAFAESENTVGIRFLRPVT